MQDIRHAWRWCFGKKFAALIIGELALVESPAGVNKGADTDDRESTNQRILSFNVPHDEMPSENVLDLLRRYAATLMKDVRDPR
jgi:hypothetical protein